MQNKVIGNTLISVILGVALAIVGMVLMGFAAATYIPKEIILWFNNPAIAVNTIHSISLFLSFGILAIGIGIIIAKRNQQWFSHCLIALTSCIVVLSILDSNVGNFGLIQALLNNLSQFIIPALCLFGASLITHQRKSAEGYS